MNDIQLYKLIADVASRFDYSTPMESYPEGDSLVYQMDILGLYQLATFTFYWKSNSEFIECSMEYEYPEGIIDKFTMVDQVSRRLTYPFMKVSANENKTILSLTGYLFKGKLTERSLCDIFEATKKEGSILSTLSNISAIYPRKPQDLKQECDDSLARTYQYFQKYGEGRFLVMRREFGFTKDELEANLNTLIKLGLIQKDELYEYLITEPKYMDSKDLEELKENINKEFIKYEK